MRVCISTDSTCDLPADIIHKYNIKIVPLYINMGSKTYKDGVDIFVSDLFNYVESGKGICSTAAANVEDYTELFIGLLKEYDAVVHINISSEFSSCYQNAVIAASELENVYVVDSRNLSSGTGLLVIEAAEMAADGTDADIIAENIKVLTGKVEASFILNTLNYLAKGGRCSSVAAIGANLLQLRPSIAVSEGKMGVSKKYRGPYDKCVKGYAYDRLHERSDVLTKRMFITHANCTPETIESVKKIVSECLPFKEIIVSVAGCTISNHCGPDCIGVLFIRK